MYAITAFTVVQRTREIGIRLALGAAAGQVWWLVVRRTALQVAIGLALGLAGALGAGRLLQIVLAQTGAADPVTLAAITVVFAGVSFAACHAPARRAAAVDPIRALRAE